MIRQEFVIDTKPWKVYVYYDFVLDDIDEVISTLEDIDFPEKLIANLSVERYKSLLSRKPRP